MEIWTGRQEIQDVEKGRNIGYMNRKAGNIGYVNR